MAILKINVPSTHWRNFRADDDYVNDVRQIRGYDPGERVWARSLKQHSQVAYVGRIPPEWIDFRSTITERADVIKPAYGPTVSVLVDPSRTAVLALLNKSKYKSLRGIVMYDNGEPMIVIWDAELADHDVIDSAIHVQWGWDRTKARWMIYPAKSDYSNYHLGPFGLGAITMNDRDTLNSTNWAQRMGGIKRNSISESSRMYEGANQPYLLRMLAAEARKAGSWEAFKKDFLHDIKHGVYWHWTDDQNFRIDPNRGPRDMSSMGGGRETPGALMVTSHLDAWSHYGKRPYVALIDLSRVPRTGYRQVNRGFGNEFYISDPSMAQVVKVMSRSAAKAFDRRQRMYLNGWNEDRLKQFYQSVVNG